MKRRDALKTTALIGGSALTLTGLSNMVSAAPVKEPLFKISLAQWSLHKSMHRWMRGNTSIGDKLDPLDFAKIAKEQFGIDAVEYVNQFYFDKIDDKSYLNELKKRADDNGVESVLIMVDAEGALGDPDESKRTQSVMNHERWLKAAQHLGCHAIRVNAQSGWDLSYAEQMKLAADGLHQLCELADGYGINVIVENHGGLSSDGQWLAGVMKTVNHPRVGTLPDFGNFCIVRNRENWRQCEKEYDKYQGMEDLMPYAKGVSAKSNYFDENGNEKNMDYKRIMEIVLKHGYHGHVGVEFEGDIPEPDGIIATKNLLERVRNELS